MALSGESHGGEFTSAFGGVAEVHGRTASAAFNANVESRGGLSPPRAPRHVREPLDSRLERPIDEAHNSRETGGHPSGVGGAKQADDNR
jgi:hypothetical protein